MTNSSSRVAKSALALARHPQRKEPDALNRPETASPTGNVIQGRDCRLLTVNPSELTVSTPRWAPMHGKSAIFSEPSVWKQRFALPAVISCPSTPGSSGVSWEKRYKIPRLMRTRSQRKKNSALMSGVASLK